MLYRFYYIISFIILLFVNPYLNAQEKQDSLGYKKLLENIEYNLSKIDFSKTKNSALKIDSLHLKVKKANSTIEKISIYNQLADLQRDNMDSLGYYANKAHDLLFSSTDNLAIEKESVFSWYLLSEHARRSGFLSKALDYSHKGMTILDQSKNKKKLFVLKSKLTRSLGIVHERNDDDKLAISTYHKLLAHTKINPIDPKQLSPYIYFNLSGLYLPKNQIDSTLTYLDKGIEHAAQYKKYNSIIRSMDLLVFVLIETNELEKAEQYLQQYIRLCTTTNNRKVLPYYYDAYATLLLKQGELENSLKFSELAYLEAKKVNNLSHRIQLGKELAGAYANTGLDERAYMLLSEMDSIETLVFSNKETNKLYHAEIEYRDNILAFEKQERQFQKKMSLQKTIVIILISILFLCALIFAVFFFNEQEKKKKQTKLLEEQKNELEKLDQLKSRFFTNISHELRTPLTLISGPLQTLLDNRQINNLSTPVVKMLKLIQRNAIQLKELVNDILDLSKLESNKIKLQEDTIPILSLVESTANEFNTLAEQFEIQYTTQFKDLPNHAILIDRRKFVRIINNLITNAIKNTPSGGSVRIIAFKKKSTFVIQVQDTGQGISAEDRPYIFDRFFQSKQTNAVVQGGTGIGLALVKEFVHLMKGKITVKSEINKGSTFSIILPYEQSENLSLTHSFTEDGTANNHEEINLDHLAMINVPFLEKEYHVLIVEDNQDMQDFVSSLLGNQYHIYSVSNGKQALELLEQKNIDLIISDIMMPEMDGYTLLKKLKSNDHLRHIPIIMLTALNSDSNKLKAISIGIDDYLTKPFSPKELLARSYNLLKRTKEREKAILTDLASKEMEVNTKPEIEERHLDSTKDISVTQLELDWLHKVEEIIRAELENNSFRLTELAKLFNLSERQFYRKVKKITGLSPKQYQKEIALQKARELLENGNYENTTAIAYSIGISHVTRFAKLYEARFGKKPSDYFYP